MKPQRVIRLLLIVTLLSIAPLLAQPRPGPRATTVYPLVLEALRPKGAKGAEGAQGLQNAGDRAPVLLVLRPEGVQDAGDRTSVLLVMRQQADLSAAAGLPTKEAKGRYVYERLRAVAEASQRDLRATLEAAQVEYRPFFLVNAVQVWADLPAVQTLAELPEVARIVPLPWVQSIPDEPEPLAAAAGPLGVEGGLVRVGAPQVWAAGFTGQGVVIAGQDTGYQWDHPALQVQYRGWDGASANHDYNWHDAIHEDNPNTLEGNPCGFDSPIPCDDHWHGTHTMGTMVGDDGVGNQVGMAPGARWIGCRNMEQGWGTPATYLECFEFFLAPYPLDGTPAGGQPDLAPHVVSNSWSCPPAEGCDAGVLESAVEALRQAGIVVVVSAGNEGPGCGSVENPPGLYQQSFTVAAFAHTTDQIAGFSSRGPVSYHGETYSKPDIAAPGVSIRSSVPGGGYGTSSGTSMAAPHVAGAVALLLSAAPDYKGDVDAIEQLLTSTAGPKLDDQCGQAEPPNNVWGWGALDVFAAVESLGPGQYPYRYFFPFVFLVP